LSVNSGNLRVLIPFSESSNLISSILSSIS
ncbi:unnamed protein product, partial [marine sediment metagenome]